MMRIRCAIAVRPAGGRPSPQIPEELASLNLSTSAGGSARPVIGRHRTSLQRATNPRCRLSPLVGPCDCKDPSENGKVCSEVRPPEPVAQGQICLPKLGMVPYVTSLGAGRLARHWLCSDEASCREQQPLSDSEMRSGLGTGSQKARESGRLEQLHRGASPIVPRVKYDIRRLWLRRSFPPPNKEILTVLTAVRQGDSSSKGCDGALLEARQAAQSRQWLEHL
jgi:hypothetical protein